MIQEIYNELVRERIARAEDKKKFDEGMDHVANAMVAQAEQLKNLRECVVGLAKRVEDIHFTIRNQKQPAPVFYEPRPLDLYEQKRREAEKRQDAQRRAREYDKWSEAQLGTNDFTIEMWAKNPAEQSKADALNGMVRSAIGNIAKARSGLG